MEAGVGYKNGRSLDLGYREASGNSKNNQLLGYDVAVRNALLVMACVLEFCFMHVGLSS